MKSKIIWLIVLTVAVAAGYYFYFGKSENGIEQGKTPAASGGSQNFAYREDQAVSRSITEYHQAVGTVRPQRESRIESRIQARVESIHVEPGDSVEPGTVMITLDDRQPAARLEKAKHALQGAKAAGSQAARQVESARAVFREAELNYQRVLEYLKADAATEEDMEKAESVYRQAEAGLARSRQALTQAEAKIRQAGKTVEVASVGLDFTKISAPAKGVVIQRMVDPGDLAMPGRPLVLMRTRSGFRLEAHVPEGLISRIIPGQSLKARIPAIDKTVDAVVRQIVPRADPKTRSFLVKAMLPEIEGIYPGMYGKLLVPGAETRVVLIPENALITTGQLDIVMVKEKDRWEKRYIKTGMKRDGMIEVLSGLNGNETISTGRR
ncbi:MAG: efflux RND transporter periplasmic adaptor subunit [Thermodesulfobacteriota bacterium]